MAKVLNVSGLNICKGIARSFEGLFVPFVEIQKVRFSSTFADKKKSLAVFGKCCNFAVEFAKKISEVLMRTLRPRSLYIIYI